MVSGVEYPCFQTFQEALAALGCPRRVAVITSDLVLFDPGSTSRPRSKPPVSAEKSPAALPFRAGPAGARNYCGSRPALDTQLVRIPARPRRWTCLSSALANAIFSSNCFVITADFGSSYSSLEIHVRKGNVYAVPLRLDLCELMRPLGHAYLVMSARCTFLVVKSLVLLQRNHIGTALGTLQNPDMSWVVTAQPGCVHRSHSYSAALLRLDYTENAPWHRLELSKSRGEGFLHDHVLPLNVFRRPHHTCGLPRAPREPFHK